jgi:hypothetical protein
MVPSIIPLSDADDAGIVPAALFTTITPLSDNDNEDLAALRNVIRAAGGGGVVQWAAGMVTTSGSRQIVVTTDRGRGWMPPDIALPADIVLPWQHELSTRWEGLLDPARVIIEYAATAGGRLTALASTHSSAPTAAAGVPFAFLDASARPSPERLDGPIADRMALQVHSDYITAIGGIAEDAERRERALWTARAAAVLAEEFTSGMDESLAARDVLTRLEAEPLLREPRRVSEIGQVWERLRDEHVLLRDRERAARQDVRDVPVGKLDTAGGGGATRALIAQLYAIEAVLALQSPSAVEALAHAVYSWQMIEQTPRLGPNAVERVAAAPLLIATPS